MVINETNAPFNIDDTHGLFLSFGDWWGTLSPFLQYKIAWIITLSAVVFMIVSIIILFIHGASSNISSIDRNVERRTHSNAGIVSVIITVLLTIIGVGLLFSLYF